MRMKSKKLKRWNLPAYGEKLDCVKSKPYSILIMIVLIGLALISIDQKVIGIAIIVLACYQIGFANNQVLCEFYDHYVVFYKTQEPDECFILFWQDVAKWQYRCGWMQDELHVILKDGTTMDFCSLSRRKIERYFRKYVPDVEMPITKQHI